MCGRDTEGLLEEGKVMVVTVLGWRWGMQSLISMGISTDDRVVLGVRGVDSVSYEADIQAIRTRGIE